jgi:hypothetical protein
MSFWGGKVSGGTRTRGRRSHSRRRPAHVRAWHSPPYAPRQTQVPQQLPHPALNLDDVPQRVGLRGADQARVAHLGQQLRDDIVAGLDARSHQRGAEKVLERVDDAVQKLESEQRLELGRRGREEEQVGLGAQAKDERGRGRVREVHQARPRGRMGEVQRQQLRRRQRARGVRVREDGVVVLVKDVERLDGGAVHGGRWVVGVLTGGGARHCRRARRAQRGGRSGWRGRGGWTLSSLPSSSSQHGGKRTMG